MFNNLKEMTMIAGDLSYNLERFFNNAIKRKNEFSHIGDIETLKVLNKKYDQNTEFLISVNDEFVGYFFTEKISQSHFRLVAAFVKQEYRKQKVFQKFIWFLFRFFKCSEIELSDVHSKNTIDSMQSLSNRLELVWQKDGNEEKYEVDTISKYYGYKPTGWVLVIKNNGVFENWPLFFNSEIPDIRQYYDWLFE